jgi:hypothetical protein
MLYRIYGIIYTVKVAVPEGLSGRNHPVLPYASRIRSRVYTAIESDET